MVCANWRRPEWQTLAALIATRYKNKRDHAIPLSRAARAILKAVPTINGGDFVFSHDGQRALGGFSKFKKQLDRLSGVNGWTLHDLRRTVLG